MIKEVQTHQTHVEVSQSIPAEVEAGIDITFKVRVACPSGCDLRGRLVKVMAPDGVVMTSELAAYDGKINETEEFRLNAPERVGEYAWSILFWSQESEGVVHEESSLPISFKTKPHETSLAVWDIRSPVVMGDRFKMKVGAKCSAGCELKGKEIGVYDETGAKVASGRLGETPWLATSALYWTEVDLAAPAKEGAVSWLVKFTAVELELPHGGASSKFSFVTVRPPEHRVTVKVIERDTQAPVENAQVRLGVYRAATGESGLAKVEVPKGTYELKFWKVGYEAPPRTVEVTEDITVHVEAVVVPEKDPDLEWM